MDNWQRALAIYTSLALVTFLPVAWALLKKIKPHPGGPGFDDSPHFSDAAKVRLKQNFERIRGTLGFWKNRAEKFRAAHLYCMSWLVPATVLVPFLAQAVKDNDGARWMISVVSLHSALIIGFSRGFKIEQNFRAYRNGESDFYDLQRRMFDSPEDFGQAEAEQLKNYFAQVELVRKAVRLAETDSMPTIEDVAPQKRVDSSATPKVTASDSPKKFPSE